MCFLARVGGVKVRQLQRLHLQSCDGQGDADVSLKTWPTQLPGEDDDAGCIHA